jgi:Fic family protein
MFEQKLHFTWETTQKIIQKIGIIDSFRGKWQVIELKNNRYLRELRRIATIESIGSSTRIEGATLTNTEVEKLIKNMKITEFQSRDEEEVFGYFEALDIILDSYEEIELSENYIKQMHSILLKFSQKDKRHRGAYKNLPNKVVANYPDGSQRTIFNTTEPHLTEKEMSEMLAWVQESRDKNSIHPLIMIGLFVYEFLSIHPFQDGNGRLSRLLTTFLLLKNDYGFAQYISFENIIEDRKQDYYRALMAGQQNRYSVHENVSEWIVFFLECIETLIQKLEQKYAVYEAKGAYLNERQQKVRAIIQEFQPVKLADIVNKLPEISINTLKKDLQYLQVEGSIEKIGDRKSSIYLLKKME